jgi:phosphoglycerate dehydrogenase-like enzyme
VVTASRSKIFVARDPQITVLLDDIAAALAAEGSEVVRGPMPERGCKLVYAPSLYAELFGSADVALFSVASICSREILAQAPKLRGVVYPAIGTESVDMAAANEFNVIVAHGAVPENYQGMAEATVMLMLMLSFQVQRSELALRENAPRPSPSEIWARPLRGKTIGLIGFGRIARATAALLQPFGAKVLVYHPQQQVGDVGATATLTDLDTLLRQSDIVSVHVTINETSRGIIGAEELALMKPSAYLVNTSRGQAIVEADLIAALKSGKIAGAALDTFEVEPLPVDSPLRSLSNVILTPHLVGQTRESLQALTPAATENVRRILKSELPLYCKNPGIQDEWLARLRALDALAK